MVFIQYGQPIGTGPFEGTHHFGHRRAIVQHGGWRYHQLTGLEVVIQFGAEHHVTYLNDIDFAQEQSCRIGYRQYIMTRATDFMNNLS